MNQYQHNTTVNSIINITLFSRNTIGWNNGTNSIITVRTTDDNDDDNDDETFISGLNIYIKIGVIAGAIFVAILLAVLAVKWCDGRKKIKVNPMIKNHDVESSNI